LLDYDRVALFIFILIRVAAFLAAGPLFIFPGVPRTAKAGLALALTLVLFPVVAPRSFAVPGGLPGFGLLAAKEAVTGLAMGFVCTLVFQSLAVAGQIMDTQMGFAMAGLFDPALGQTTITARFLHLLGLVLFFILDGHHVLIAALVGSFQLVPLAGAALTGAGTLALIRVFAQMVALGVQIAAPVVAVVLIIDICLGLLGRTAPQMNVFMLGFPLKIGLGLLTLSVMAPLLGVVFRSLAGMMENDLYIVLRGMH